MDCDGCCTVERVNLVKKLDLESQEVEKTEVKEVEKTEVKEDPMECEEQVKEKKTKPKKKIVHYEYSSSGLFRDGY